MNKKMAKKFFTLPAGRQKSVKKRSVPAPKIAKKTAKKPKKITPKRGKNGKFLKKT